MTHQTFGRRCQLPCFALTGLRKKPQAARGGSPSGRSSPVAASGPKGRGRLHRRSRVRNACTGRSESAATVSQCELRATDMDVGLRVIPELAIVYARDANGTRRLRFGDHFPTEKGPQTGREQNSQPEPRSLPSVDAEWTRCRSKSPEIEAKPPANTDQALCRTRTDDPFLTSTPRAIFAD
jgi:hypothetical protein